MMYEFVLIILSYKQYIPENYYKLRYPANLLTIPKKKRKIETIKIELVALIEITEVIFYEVKIHFSPLSKTLSTPLVPFTVEYYILNPPPPQKKKLSAPIPPIYYTMTHTIFPSIQGWSYTFF